ncbi:MAG: polyprenyl synthetase family protein [Victivallales bacterium]|nr:polyprenyl synthetase family protein [Victivallales bacterium]
MTGELLRELEINSDLMGRVIGEDMYPVSVMPECLREAVRDYPLRGGKRLRSALLRFCCGLFGGDVDSARFAAAAVEIYHNWTLVHDDIIDDDALRRHRASSHASLAEFASSLGMGCSDALKYGRDMAMLAGDIQHGWAANMLLRSVECGVLGDVVLWLARELHENVGRVLISGEALDVDYSHKIWDMVTIAEVRRMLEMKTGALLDFCAVSGAAIGMGIGEGVREDSRVALISKYARAIGLAFQLRDDWLGIYSDEEETGKPLASDLSGGKPTMLFLRTLENLDDGGRSRFMAFVRRPKFSHEDICEIRRIISDSGAEAAVLDECSALAQDAKSLVDALPRNRYNGLLSDLADHVTTRNA